MKISQSPDQESINLGGIDISYSLPYDLVTCEWMCEKVAKSKSYAQHLYAALCNNDFIKKDIWELLKENRIQNVSWRYAGRIIADMRKKGDYLDWYCSGITTVNGVLSEGTISEEIKTDLNTLGWLPYKYKEAE